MTDSPVEFRPPPGWEELMAAIDKYRLQPYPTQGTVRVGGVLVLVAGRAVMAALHAADPGGQLVPPPADPGSYRWVGVHASGMPGGGWRLLEDGEERAAGALGEYR